MVFMARWQSIPPVCSALNTDTEKGIDTLLAGDVATGKAILRDYINAAIGFGELADATNIPAKSLMRMFGPKGNPRAGNLFQVIHLLQDREGIHLEVITS
jgi:DNA-binding phage protein